MTTRRGGRRRSGSSRRSYEWNNTTTDEVVLAANSQITVDMTSDFRNLIGRAGCTLVRIVGELSVRPAGGANILHQWTAGISMVEEDAATALIFPDPRTDQGIGWLWWIGGHEFESSLDTKKYLVDVKGQRRFRNRGDQLHFIIENDLTSDSIGWAVNFRALFRLP